MADETMTLIEKLRNPAWEVAEWIEGSPTEHALPKSLKLNVEQTRATMEEAAHRIEDLEKQLARKSGMGVAENQPDAFNELKK